MILSGAEILVEELVNHGVKTVFGYPGGTVVNIYDELDENAHRITHVLAAHEQGAAHAADAYARVTGGPGVVIATSGPGATNLITGIANAYLDSVPLVAITGNVAVPLLGRDTFQEIDIVGVTQPIVKHNYIVRDVTKLEAVLKEAFLIANTGRKGPVLVDIPKSVQTGTCEYNNAYNASITSPAINTRDVSRFDEVIAAIDKSARPYIYCGGGVIAASAEAAVLALSKKIAAPIGLSMMGISAVPNSYELNLGLCGMHGRYASSMAQSEADLVIGLGVRFSDRATGNVTEYAKNCTVIHIDIDAAELGKNVESKISMCGDLAEILPLLLERVTARKNPAWLARVGELKAAEIIPPRDAFTPRNIIELIGTHCDEDTIVATDVGQHQMWVTQYYKFEKSHKLITSGGLGAMGFGLGAAIGACIAGDRQKTLLFTGDGSFGMNLAEMATAVTENLPLVIILFNNGVLGMVRQWQTLFFDKRYAQTTLTRKTDFPALARAFGAAGYSANSLAELEAILKSLPEKGGPCLIDCAIGEDELVLPMIPAGGSINDILID